jgi:hypothetical protein
VSERGTKPLRGRKKIRKRRHVLLLRKEGTLVLLLSDLRELLRQVRYLPYSLHLLGLLIVNKRTNFLQYRIIRCIPTFLPSSQQTEDLLRCVLTM